MTSRRELIGRELDLESKLDARKTTSQKQAEYALASDKRQPVERDEDRPLTTSERQAAMAIASGGAVS